MAAFSALFSLFIACFLAATVIPFSSEIVLVTFLKTNGTPAWLLVLIASVGNTAGGITGYLLGRLAKWEWLETYLKVKRSKVETYREKSARYGSWLALLTWTPLIGDFLCVVLGFFRTPVVPTVILMFLGKTIRYILIAMAVRQWWPG